jgi:hypothetical protein
MFTTRTHKADICGEECGTMDRGGLVRPEEEKRTEGVNVVLCLKGGPHRKCSKLLLFIEEKFT